MGSTREAEPLASFRGEPLSRPLASFGHPLGTISLKDRSPTSFTKRAHNGQPSLPCTKESLVQPVPDEPHGPISKAFSFDPTISTLRSHSFLFFSGRAGRRRHLGEKNRSQAVRLCLPSQTSLRPGLTATISWAVQSRTVAGTLAWPDFASLRFTTGQHSLAAVASTLAWPDFD